MHLLMEIQVLSTFWLLWMLLRWTLIHISLSLYFQFFWKLPRSVTAASYSNFCVTFCAMLSHFSRVWLFGTLWTVACQSPLSMGFSGKEYWSGLPFPPPGDLPDPGIKSTSPALAGSFFISSTTWETTEESLNCSPQWLYHFTFPPAMNKCSSFFIPLPPYITSFFGKSSSGWGWGWYVMVVMNYISLMTNDVFMYFLAICISSLEKCLFQSLLIF